MFSLPRRLFQGPPARLSGVSGRQDDQGH